MKKNLLFLSVLCLIGSVIFGCNSRRASVVSFEVETLPGDLNIDIEGSKNQETLSPVSSLLKNGQVKRNWTSQNRWGNPPGPPVQTVTLNFIQEKDGDSRTRHIWRPDYYTSTKTLAVNWPQSKADGQPLSVTIEGAFGNILFEGELGKLHGQKLRSKATAFGIMTLTPDAQKLEAIETAFGQKALLDDLVTLIVKNIDATDLEGLADSGVTFTLSEAIVLIKHNRKASDVKKLIESGYTFKGKEIVKLAERYVSFDQAAAWRKAGYILSVDELIYAKQRYLKPEKAVAWQGVGYELNLKEL